MLQAGPAHPSSLEGLQVAAGNSAAQLLCYVIVLMLQVVVQL
jgi:hypothetical protein